MSLALFFGLYLWISFFRGGRLLRAAAAGALFGVAFLFLQKALIVAGIFGASSIAALALGCNSRGALFRAIKGIILVLFSFAAVAACGALAARQLGFLNEMLFWSYDYNEFYFFAAQLPDWVATPPGHALMRAALQTLLPFAAGFAFAGIALYRFVRLRRAAGGDVMARAILALSAFFYVALLMRNRIANAQYFIALYPILAILAAPLFRRGARGFASRFAVAFAALSLLEGAVLFSLLPGNAPQLRAQRLILSESLPGERIFAAPEWHPIFRGDADYFWLNEPHMRDVFEQMLAARALPPRDFRSGAAALPAVVASPRPEKMPSYWEGAADKYVATGFPGVYVRLPDIGR